LCAKPLKTIDSLPHAGKTPLTKVRLLVETVVLVKFFDVPSIEESTHFGFGHLERGPFHFFRVVFERDQEH
jgi:hypothetical protein